MSSVPALSVIVCTHERSDDLVCCLDALGRQTVPSLDVVVVDNVPRTPRTEEVARSAAVRCVREPRRGLNRLATRVCGPLVRGSSPTPTTTPCRSRSGRRIFEPPFLPAGAGQVGAGANMAFRREALEAVGGFDEAFDAGTPTPQRGRHRNLRPTARGRVPTRLRTRCTCPPSPPPEPRRVAAATLRLRRGGVRLLTHRVLDHRDLAAARFAVGTLGVHGIRRVARSLLGRPDELPRDLVLAEVAGCLYGPLAHLRARRNAGGPPRTGRPSRAI